MFSVTWVTWVAAAMHLVVAHLEQAGEGAPCLTSQWSSLNQPPPL